MSWKSSTSGLFCARPSSTARVRTGTMKGPGSRPVLRPDIPVISSLARVFFIGFTAGFTLRISLRIHNA